MRTRLVALLACTMLVAGCIPLLARIAALADLPGPTGTPRPTIPQPSFTPSVLLAGATCGLGIVGGPPDLTDLLTEMGASKPTCLDLGHGSAPIGVFTVEGQQAIEFWEFLSLLVDGEGWWPVLVGDGPSLDLLIEAATVSEVDVDEIFELAADIDYDHWVTERTTEIIGQKPLPENGETFEPDLRPSSYSVHMDPLTRDFRPRMYVLLVPVRDSPDVVAQLLFGCWNENPCPAEHLAVLRHWHEAYDVDVVSIGDLLELRVGKPLTDWEESLQLAREQYAYDPDIVDQGFGTINRLAQEIRHGGTWAFWWD